MPLSRAVFHEIMSYLREFYHEIMVFLGAFYHEIMVFLGAFYHEIPFFKELEKMDTKKRKRLFYRRLRFKRKILSLFFK